MEKEYSERTITYHMTEKERREWLDKLLDVPEAPIPKYTVGEFGVSSKDERVGFHTINWVETGYRNRVPNTPIPMNGYHQSLFDSMFKGWK